MQKSLLKRYINKETIAFCSFQPAFAGLTLVYVIQTMELTQYTVRKTSDIENYMTSVERIIIRGNLKC